MKAGGLYLAGRDRRLRLIQSSFLALLLLMADGCQLTHQTVITVRGAGNIAQGVGAHFESSIANQKS